ncbi:MULTISPECIES: type II toxin-antitoxin system VapC family toxin [Mycobacterium]|uniref:Ribonuclease VapC n=1 Tax=Mycobacterium kiyosense TaxID=2871094 RepID=A0A9P3Q8W0_9MYCO|nr:MULTISPECIES: type II toxin-antitoxin system VapC family toxin [Mycobacterium]BDB45603.1 ribonuclease VapC [Mycobacterium kiyosense]BDE11225.1 ribonuclease VapC [Mycobacterium sp. 20KCMC460]GLB85776.1 ribonuclease VapC [Mycobacterium kiyosense]GLB92434.1 ribonuclease VapC [Mycobacterium kiyosense]GLB98496.1 ribonuclease VapC [Mycobacterium kiyosense]
MIYLDTSALTKLLIAEAETAALRAWLNAQHERGEHAATSTLGRIELMRAVYRYAATEYVGRARYLLDGLDMVTLSAPVLTAAETIGPPTLRSLDAIHLAAAAQLKQELTAFVTYDRRLLAGCHDVGIPAISPGS